LYRSAASAEGAVYDRPFFVSVRRLYLRRKKAVIDHCCSISEKPDGVSFSLWEKDGRAKREPDRAKTQENGRMNDGQCKT